MNSEFYGAITDFTIETESALQMSMADMAEMIRELQARPQEYFIDTALRRRTEASNILYRHKNDNGYHLFLQDLFNKNEISDIQTRVDAGLPLKSFDGRSESDSIRRAVGLCFLEGFSLLETDAFLRKTCFLPGLHLRDYKHIIWAFFLHNRSSNTYRNDSGIHLWFRSKDYINEYAQIYESFDPVVNLAVDNGQRNRRIDIEDIPRVTQQCREMVLRLANESALRDFLDSELARNVLGAYNATAYEYLTRTMKYISQALEPLKTGIPKTLTADSLVPSFENKSDMLNAIENPFTREIIASLPSYDSLLSTLKIARTRRYAKKGSRPERIHVTPVNRETLLLFEVFYEVISCRVDTKKSHMEDEARKVNRRILRINDVLNDCGFPPLYPRRIFDYIMLNSLDPINAVYNIGYLPSEKSDSVAPTDTISETRDKMHRPSDMVRDNFPRDEESYCNSFDENKSCESELDPFNEPAVYMRERISQLLEKLTEMV